MTGAFKQEATESTGMGIIPPSVTLDIELSKPLSDIPVDEKYFGALALIRWRGRPVGSVVLPVRGQYCRAADIKDVVENTLFDAILRARVRSRIESPLLNAVIESNDLDDDPEQQASPVMPMVTIAVCTRGRPEMLGDCLESLTRQNYPDYEILVVDNAPQDEHNKELVNERFPECLYVVEPEPGLSRARNKALEEANGDIIAFTDDDTVADPGWLSHLTQAFLEDPMTGVVTGLIVPFELETEPQIMLESHWGFGRGYLRRWYRVNIFDKHKDVSHLNTFKYGAGANMAFRKECFSTIGNYDINLGAGTPSGGGEDMDLFFRALESGYSLTYEPAAIIRHRHRRDFSTMDAQIRNWVSGHHAFLSRVILKSDRLRWQAIKHLVRDWLNQLKLALSTLLLPTQIPGGLLRSQLFEVLHGVYLYSQTSSPEDSNKKDTELIGPEVEVEKSESIAIRIINLFEEVADINDVSFVAETQLIVKAGEKMLGQCSIQNCYANIPRVTVLDRIAEELYQSLLKKREPALQLQPSPEEVRMIDDVICVTSSTELLENKPDISIIIASKNRPEYLQDCLQRLGEIEYSGKYEIIVVDNNSSPELYGPIFNEYPGVIGISQPAGGKSTALNTGIEQSNGEIIAFIDDDVLVPMGWLDRVARCFERNDVHASAGLILPQSLDADSEILFERHVSFNRGFKRLEFGPGFFYDDSWHAVPVWNVGAGANLIIRRSILEETGPLCELLGPGTATYSAEDAYIIYKVAKSGHTIIYDPDICVTHNHRNSKCKLYLQLYHYGVGMVSFQLITLFRDGDFRALKFLLIDQPVHHFRRLFGGKKYPLGMLFAEIVGNVVAPVSLMRACVASLLSSKESTGNEVKSTGQ